MTHRRMIAAGWFTLSQIARAFDISREDATLLCDRISGNARASGGYGCNIIEKAASAQDYEALEEAAEKLAHILPRTSCPACGE